MAEAKDDGYDIGAILNQMREEYWQGLEEEQAAPREAVECLVVVLGGRRYAFETRFACEVIRVPRLVKVPAAQSLIAGIFNLRGEITAAMDVRPMLGVEPLPLSAAGRIVVVRCDSFATGILVESALGVKGLSFDLFEPAGGATRDNEFIRGHFNEPDGVVVLLDMEELLSAPEIMVGEP